MVPSCLGLCNISETIPVALLPTISHLLAPVVRSSEWIGADGREENAGVFESFKSDSHVVSDTEDLLSCWFY